MSRIIITSDTNVEYVLEFDRSTVEVAERTMDLDLSGLMGGKLTYFPQLFQAAFLKHHRKAKASTVEELFERVENKQELFEALVTMYVECVSTLVEEPEEGKAISWKVG